MQAVQQLRTGRGCLLLAETDLDVSKALRVVANCTQLLHSKQQGKFGDAALKPVSKPPVTGATGSGSTESEAQQPGTTKRLELLHSGQLDTRQYTLCIKVGQCKSGTLHATKSSSVGCWRVHTASYCYLLLHMFLWFVPLWLSYVAY